MFRILLTQPLGPPPHQPSFGAGVLFRDGGNNSTVLANLFADLATHVKHTNTGIGIERPGNSYVTWPEQFTLAATARDRVA
jgi:hypothetical protein